MINDSAKEDTEPVWHGEKDYGNIVKCAGRRDEVLRWQPDPNGNHHDTKSSECVSARALRSTLSV